jgi:hypothetical protein
VTIESLMTRTATITRRAQTGAVGRTNTPTWVDADPVEVSCYFEQSGATEVVVGRQTQIVDATLVLPAGTELDASDRVSIDGDTYEVIGTPSRPHRPGTGEHHVEAYLQRVVA